MAGGVAAGGNQQAELGCVVWVEEILGSFRRPSE